jgi:YVTN family beta-propeller protein
MNVTRRRRLARTVRPRPLARRNGQRFRALTLGSAVLVLVGGGGVAYGATRWLGSSQVGVTSRRGVVLPSDQALNPVGQRLLVNNGKLISSTVSPDGTHLAALTTDRSIALTIVDLEDYSIQQQVGTAAGADLRISRNDVGQEGPTYSPDGTSLWMPQIDGFARFPVNADGSVSAPTDIPIPAQGKKRALPAQAAFAEDGSTVYAAVNGQNRVVAMDATTGAITQSWDVGIAPRDLVMVDGKLYVSNEGGRFPRDGEPTLKSYRTQVPASHFTGATTTGSVSVIAPADPTADVASIDVGLHPTAMLAADGALFVADTFSDDVSVIDTDSDEVVQTFPTQPWPVSQVGYAPDGIALTGDGQLLVTLGRANAMAVYDYFSPYEPVDLVGLLPMDYYPENVHLLGDEVLVTNLRGIGERGPQRTLNQGPGTSPAHGHNTHDSTGTLLRFALPDEATIADLTAKVFRQNGWNDAWVGWRHGPHARPQPVPRRLGDPSPIKHVFLIVKENRTYDQIFGDMTQGNGDPSLAQFGEDVTPNQHALARQFGLYDNTYSVGTNSAEGHNWLMQSDNPEYSESSAGLYQRGYGTEDDALGRQRTGTLWSGALAAGNTVRNYGEYLAFEHKPAGATWSDFYCDAKNMAATGADTALETDSSSPIPSLDDVTLHTYPTFDLGIPDIYRYEIWKRDFDAIGPANLNVLWLSSDHTGGDPNPVAMVADNDLAVGKIVDHISHSRYWKRTAIFVVEDDTQNGVDHVDGARGPVEVISPWARHGAVDSRYYSQITMIRTIEQILGITPMNQRDAAATPMRTAFSRVADFTPFDAVPNRIPLTYGVEPPPTCGEDTVARRYAKLAPADALPAPQKQLARAWEAWRKGQGLTSANPGPDRVNPVMMDHYAWYAAHGWSVPYPGDATVEKPNQVRGRFLSPSDDDG